MAYNYPEVRKFLGLYAQANSFGLPDGAMERCLNVTIDDDDVIIKSRGYYTYYTPLITTLNNIFLYERRLLAAFSTKMAYFTDTGVSPNEVGTATDLVGATVSVTGTRIARSFQQSGNFYMTSDNGVMKIDAFNGKVFNSGTPPGLDIRGNFLPENGPIPGDSEVGYRVVFGRRDINDNLLLGTPSDILTLTNAPLGDVAWTRSGGGPYTITVTSPLHNLTPGMSLTISDGHGVPDGAYTVLTIPTANTFTFALSVDPGVSGTLDYKTSRVALIEFSIPQGIEDAVDQYFFQLYRSTASSSGLTPPESDFRLVEETVLTAGEISAGFVSVQDDVEDILVEFAPELYTNPNSREGELQANARPPLCEDVALFRNYAFYGNCQTRHLLNLDVIDAGSLANGDYIELKVDATLLRYYAVTGSGNRTVRSESITNAAGALQIDYLAHGFADGYKIYISSITGGTLNEGYYYVINQVGANFQISLTSGGSPVAYSAVTSLYFEGVTNGTYPIFQLDKISPSVATQLRNTAQGIVKAINRDPLTLTYANYISGTVDTPGKMRFTGINFTGAIYVRASSTTAGEAFSPILPDSFASGTQVYSRNDAQPNVIFISKVGEPEAVPIVNSIIVGSKKAALLRILPLQDSVIVLKEDGVFKITGDNPGNFQATILDNTVIVVAASSAALLNNQVYFLANQGICVATDSAVEIVSRRIENVIEPVIGKTTLSMETAAVGYESARAYEISTILPNDDTKTITYVHNTINDTWTQASVLFSAGVVGPENKLFLVSSNRILKERKYGNRLDFTGQNHAVTVSAVSTDLFSATINVTGYDPQPGDVLLKDDVFSRISEVVNLGSSNYVVAFQKVTNVAVSDSINLYERIVSEVKMAPFHAGEVGRVKQYSQLQFHTRGPSVTRMSITFTGPTFGGSEETEWLSTSVAQTGGWGAEPWGFFPWGLPDGLDISYMTLPAPAIRLWVPLFQQRSEFIQTQIVHREAGEAIEIQSMSWAIRGYGERTSK